MNRFFLPALLLTLLLCGCAGSILSHKPYALQAGIVVEASPKKVSTVWPKDQWTPQGGSTIESFSYTVIGDEVYKVCPETVPAVGERFKRADLAWDNVRKCWQWKSIPFPK